MAHFSHLLVDFIFFLQLQAVLQGHAVSLYIFARVL